MKKVILPILAPAILDCAAGRSEWTITEITNEAP